MFCRLLVVVDNDERIALFRQWIPDEFRAIFVKRSGGRCRCWVWMPDGCKWGFCCTMMGTTRWRRNPN